VPDYVKQAWCQRLYRTGKNNGRRAATALRRSAGLRPDDIDFDLRRARRGLSVLLNRFPNARAIATPKSVETMRQFLVPPLDQIMDRLWPGQLATKLVAAEPDESETFTLERHEFRIIEQRRTDCPDSTSLYK